jgi:hypothetical protein
MQRYTVYLYLETAPHVSGGTSTYHQERIQLYLQHLVFVTPLLLSAAIVEDLEPVSVCCGWRAPHLMYQKFSDCLFPSNSAIPQQFVTPISSLRDAKVCYLYWNA